ncbi:M60 family metallopeptidase [Rahnella inusitata]|uniref:M60 family metallopeptidase n=1 Tax=Rahnella inusitata TaxID=58169 RepID=UPI0039B06E53
MKNLTSNVFALSLIALCMPMMASADNTSANQTQNAWWTNYADNEGFNEALQALGTSQQLLNANISDSLARSANVNDNLFWLKRTLEIYPLDNKNAYNIPVTEGHTNGRNRSTGNGRNASFITRTYGKTGNVIKVSAGEIPQGVGCSVLTGVGFNSQNHAYDEQVLNGSSTLDYEMKRDGLVMVDCVDGSLDMPNVDKSVHVEITEGGTEQPIFIFGENSQTEWKTLSNQTTPSGLTFLFDGRSRMMATNAKMKGAQNVDMVNLLRQYLDITVEDDHLNGFDASTTLNQPSRSLLATSFQACCFASGGQGFTAIGNPSDKFPQNTSWLDWHEYGHQHQMGWSWSSETEVTVNLYSIANCTRFLGDMPATPCHPNKAVKELTWSPYSVGLFLRSGEVVTTGDEFKRATMYAQLNFTYPDMYAQLGKAYRSEYNFGNNKSLFNSSQQKRDWFVINASKYSKNDLREYFQRWDIAYSAEASAAIEAMKLSQPLQPAQELTVTLDSNYGSATVNTSMLDGTAKNIGFIVPANTAGPKSLAWANSGETMFSAQVVDSKMRPFTVMLRGTKSTGQCGRYTLNTSANCVTGTTQFIQIRYIKEDNLNLPEGSYHGTAHLLGRDWHHADWAADLKINVNITK